LRLIGTGLSPTLPADDMAAMPQAEPSATGPLTVAAPTR